MSNPDETTQSPATQSPAIKAALKISEAQKAAEKEAAEKKAAEKRVAEKKAAESLPKPKHDRPQPWRLRSLVLIRHYFPPVVHRPVIQVSRLLKRQLAVNSGDWHWMANNPLPLKSLNRSLWREADPSFNYFIMLFLSGVIAALGLLAGSTAAIIGAMIVAPLMGPITAMAFAITMGNRRLLKRSGWALITGGLLTVGTAYFITALVGLSTLNPEILERTRPTLIDLAIGLAAGAAGAFAKTRKGVADALPGVAIAVALVPPLSVIGIGLAFGDRAVITGSTLLFATNLAGIILSGGLVFIWQDYGSLKRARQGLTTSILVLCMLGIPLGLSLRELIVEERARSLVGTLIRRETETFKDTDIRKLKVNEQSDYLKVELEVAAPTDSISENQVNLVHQFLEKKLDRTIQLEVQVFPVRAFSVPSENPPSVKSPSANQP